MILITFTTFTHSSLFMSYYDGVDRYDLIDVSIDLSNSIFGFENYIPKRPQTPFVGKENYLLYRSRPTEYGGLVLYQFKYLDVIQDGDLEGPFEDFAYRTFLKFTDSSVFDSKDFLIQLIITFWLIAIKHVYSIPRSTTNEARMGTEQKQNDRVGEVVNHFLKILYKPTKRLSDTLCQKYNLDESEVFAIALNSVSLCVTGEKPKNIESHFKNIIAGKDKLHTKSAIRGVSLHSAFAYNQLKNPSKKRLSKYLNHASMAKSYTEEVLSLFNKTGDATVLMLLSDEALLYATADSLNINSNRIYKPNSKISLPQFLFSRNGTVRDRVRDLSKNLKSLDFKYNDESVYEDYTPPSSKRWGRHRNNFTKQQQEQYYQFAEPILTKKEREVYSNWLQDNYFSNNRTESTHLSNIRKKLREKAIGRPDSLG